MKKHSLVSKIHCFIFYSWRLERMYFILFLFVANCTILCLFVTGRWLAPLAGLITSITSLFHTIAHFWDIFGMGEANGWLFLFQFRLHFCCSDYMLTEFPANLLSFPNLTTLQTTISSNIFNVWRRPPTPIEASDCSV